jgi:hypothetical protein
MECTVCVDSIVAWFLELDGSLQPAVLCLQVIFDNAAFDYGKTVLGA